MSNLLAPTLFSRLIIKIQQEELRRANIPNFEQCKYCTFGTSKRICVLKIHIPMSTYERYAKEKKKIYIQRRIDDA